MLTVTKEFILACLRNDLTFSPEPGQIDWSKILSKGYRIASLVYFKAIKLYPALNIPKEIKEKMLQQYFQTYARNEHLKCLAVELASAFSREGIELVFLKGVALLATIYKNDPGFRFMNDVDVLVRKGDLFKAEALLQGLGYIKAQHQCSDEHFIRQEPLFHDRYLNDQISLEVHWEIDYKKNSALLDRFWRSVEPAMIEDAKIMVPSPAACLFLACVNSSRDFSSVKIAQGRRSQTVFYCCIHSLFEIKQLVSFYGSRMDWNHFLNLTMSSSRKAEIFDLMLLAGKYANVGIPEFILKSGGNGLRRSIDRFLSGADPQDDFAPLFFTRDVLMRLERALMDPGWAAQCIVQVFCHHDNRRGLRIKE